MNAEKIMEFLLYGANLARTKGERRFLKKRGRL